jgi:secreted trypsin-like serine protease
MACSTGSAYFSQARTTLLFRGLAGPLAGFSALAVVVACSSAEDDENVGQKVQTVIEGTQVMDARPGGHVLVQVQKDLLTAKRGSGTLLTNEWVLTAAHVLDDAPSTGAITVRLEGETVTAERVHIHPLYVGASRTIKNPIDGIATDRSRTNNVDVALIKLRAPLNAAVTYDRGVSSAATGQIVGSTVSCFGYTIPAENLRERCKSRGELKGSRKVYHSEPDSGGHDALSAGCDAIEA